MKYTGVGGYPEGGGCRSERPRETGSIFSETPTDGTTSDKIAPLNSLPSGYFENQGINFNFS